MRVFFPLFVVLFSSLSLASPPITPATRDFMRACKDGDLETARLLISRPDVDPQAQNGLALRLATAFDHAEIVRLLLNPSRAVASETQMEVDNDTVAEPPQKKRRLPSAVDPAVNSQESLRLACAKGNLDLVRELMTHTSVDPAAQEMEALVLAVKSGNMQLVKFLLESGRVSAAPDKCDALLVAAQLKSYKMIDVLMDHESFYPHTSDYAFGVLRRQLCHHSDKSYLYEVYRHILEHPSIEPYQKLVHTARDKQYWLFKIIALKGEPLRESDMRIFLDIHTDDKVVMQLILLHPFVDVENYFKLACKRGFFDLAEDALESGRLDLELAFEPTLTAIVQTEHSNITAWLLAIAKDRVSQEIAQDAINKAFSRCCKDFCEPNGETEHFKIFMDWNMPDANGLKNLLVSAIEALSRFQLDQTFSERMRDTIYDSMSSPNFNGVVSFSTYMLTRAMTMNDFDLATALWSHDTMKAHVSIDLFHDWILCNACDMNGVPRPQWSPYVICHPDVSELPIWDLNASDEVIIHSLFIERIMALPSNFGYFSQQLDKVSNRKLSIDMVFAQFEKMKQDGAFGGSFHRPSVSPDRLRIARFLQEFIALHTLSGIFIEHGMPMELCRHILIDLLMQVLRDIRAEDMAFYRC